MDVRDTNHIMLTSDFRVGLTEVPFCQPGSSPSIHPPLTKLIEEVYGHGVVITINTPPPSRDSSQVYSLAPMVVSSGGTLHCQSNAPYSRHPVLAQMSWVSIG